MSASTNGTGLDKSGATIRGMFARIAPRYDLLNRLLSAGTDVAWRRRATRLLAPGPGEAVLDLCSGTGDLALEVTRASRGGARVTAADFTFEMLALGRRKFLSRGARIPEAGADGLALPFAAGTFDGVTAAFGVRNFEDLDRGLAEVHRVLRPGGRFVILEFTPEAHGPLGKAVALYTRTVLPVIGRLISRDPGAYTYLPDSVGRWPSPPELAGRLRAAGFPEVAYEVLTFGIAAVHVARKGGRA